MARIAFVCLALALATSSAAAQPPGLTPSIEKASESPLPDRKRTKTGTAFAITLAATSLPAILGSFGGERGPAATAGGILGTAGMVFGPSAGHWYAGRRFTTGLGLRLVGAGIVAGMVIEDHRERLDTGTVIVGAMAAAALWETGVIWDLVTLPRAVRRANRREHPLVVAPTGTGIAVAGAF